MTFSDLHNERREDLDKTGVYVIFHLSKPEYYYVGSAAKYDKTKYRDVGFLQRWRNHISTLRRGIHHNHHLQRVVLKYGVDGIRFKIIECCDPFSCPERETFNIRKYKSEYKVYNFSDFSHSILGTKQSKETVEKRTKLRRKPVYQYDFNGVLVKKWPSYSSVKKEYPSAGGISKCLVNNTGSSAGYQWSYKLQKMPNYKQKYWRIERPVYQFDYAGSLLKCHSSPTEAAKATGTGVQYILRSCNKTAVRGGKYIWSFLPTENRRYPESKKRIPVIQYNLSMEYIQEHPSVTHAARHIGVGTSNISNCCKQKAHCKSVCGYIFRYKAA